MKFTKRGNNGRLIRHRAIALRATVVAVCGVTLAIGLAGPSAEGCGWEGFERSLRFSSSFENKDRLPPLPRTVQAVEEVEEPFWYFEPAEYGGCGCGRDYEIEDTLELAKTAMRQIRDGDLDGGRKGLERFLAETDRSLRDGTLSVYWAEELQPSRNDALDLLDVLGEVGRGASVDSVKSYTQVRTEALRKNERPQDWMNLAIAARHDPRLEDNLAYLNAAYHYHRSRFDEAGEAFDEMLERWPASEKRNAALLMSGLSRLRSAQVFYADPRTELLAMAERRFRQLLDADPDGRYATDAVGRLAQIALLRYDNPTALVTYYRMLGNAKDRSVQREGLKSLSLARERATEENMKEVERRLEIDPDTALVYAYYEVYNFEMDGYFESAWEESTEKEARLAQLERIVTFASKMADRFPKNGVGAAFAVRVAGACLDLARFDEASKFATRALAAGPSERERHDALYALATAEHGAGRYDRARTAIRRLLAAAPDRRMQESARRRLAMICEDDDDLAGALDTYRALGYEADVAYVIDVLMSVEDLSEYVIARPADPDVDWLRYALAIRLMRSGKYDEARAELMKVRTGGSQFDDWSERMGHTYAIDGRTLRPVKDPTGIDPRVKKPRAEWVAADLQTLDDLLALQQAAWRDKGYEGAAEAKYQFAAYLFEHESLLFYNPSLWWGSRTGCIKSLSYGDVFRLPGESERLWIYNNEHDALAQSIDAFLDVKEGYPYLNVARDAMYSAAVAHERLSRFNGYWSDQYGSGRHAGRWIVTFDDVRRTYPGYQLPKGTIGWEPATRTVNGEPGWDPPPPKPKPVPLWRHYAKRVPEVLAEFGGPVVDRVWGWVSGGTEWVVGVVKRAAVLVMYAILLATILGAWIAAMRASLRLALETANGHVRSRALLPATSAYRPRDHAWLAWAVEHVGQMRSGMSGLSIVELGREKDETSVGTKLDDRIVVFVERARLFLATTPEGLACLLVVLTHAPMILFLTMLM